MTICNWCWWVVWRDCWNPQECEQITQSMNQQYESQEVCELRQEIDRLTQILTEHGIDFKKPEPTPTPPTVLVYGMEVEDVPF